MHLTEIMKWQKYIHILVYLLQETPDKKGGLWNKDYKVAKKVGPTRKQEILTAWCLVHGFAYQPSSLKTFSQSKEGNMLSGK